MNLVICTLVFVVILTFFYYYQLLYIEHLLCTSHCANQFNNPHNYLKLDFVLRNLGVEEDGRELRWGDHQPPHKYIKKWSKLGLPWWSRLVCVPSAGGPGLISGEGTRSHKPQLKIPHATTKTWCNCINKQINKYFLNVQS